MAQLAQSKNYLEPKRSTARTLWLSELRLTNFRIHSELSLSLPSLAPVILTGKNGAGKTSLLEAISLLGPGQGLRSTASDRLLRHGCAQPIWGVAASLVDCQNITHKISVAYKQNNQGSVRKHRMNGRNSSAIEIARHVNLFWLTPAMARFFAEGAQRSARRRFMDRIVMGLELDHAHHLVAFARAKQARQIVLEQERSSDAWLTTLEAQMAEHAIHIGQARAASIAKLNQHMETLKPEAFPTGRVEIIGAFETQYLKNLDQDNTILYRTLLAQNRNKDKAARRVVIGPHQSDFLLSDQSSGLASVHCSTGEVKALLTGLVLASANLAQQEKAMLPIILLDEIAAHLDEIRRLALFQKLAEGRAQIWMTGTDRDIFSPMRMIAHCFEIQPNKALPS